MIKDSRTNTPETIKRVDELELEEYTETTRNDMLWKNIWGIGGGSTEYFPDRVTLSDKFLLFSDPENGGSKNGSAARTNHTLGGIFLHEFIYHLHPLGSDENRKPLLMRYYYNIHGCNSELCKDHGAGDNTHKMITQDKIKQYEQSKEK